MSQGRKRLFSVLFVFVMLAVASLACGGSDNVVAAPVKLSPAQIKQKEMDNAAYYGAFVVEFHIAGGRYGICYGTEKIVSLEAGETRRVELTSQEAANASLCQWNEEAGKWGMVQDIGGVAPGHYLTWDANGSLGWTR